MVGTYSTTGWTGLRSRLANACYQTEGLFDLELLLGSLGGAVSGLVEEGVKLQGLEWILTAELTTVDSKKLEHGPGTIYAVCFFFSRLWCWGTVIFQLSGFCRRRTDHPSSVGPTAVSEPMQARSR